MELAGARFDKVEQGKIAKKQESCDTVFELHYAVHSSSSKSCAWGEIGMRTLKSLAAFISA